MKAFMVALSACMLVGCTNLSPPASAVPLESNKAYWFSYDASRRGSIIVPENAKVRACSEPAPDVALSLESALKATLSDSKNDSLGIDSTMKATAIALAGRNDNVLLARETLYSICLQSLNGTLDTSVKSLLTQLFHELKEIAIAEAKSAQSKADQAKSDAEKSKTDLEKLKLQTQ